MRINQHHETHASCEAFSLAAFEYEFGALDRLDNPITDTYLNLVYVSLLHHPPCFLVDTESTHRNSAFGTKPPLSQMFISDVAQYFPYGVISWLFEKDKGPGSIKMRENRKQTHAVARSLIDAKRENMRNGDQGKDVLSLLSES